MLTLKKGFKVGAIIGLFLKLKHLIDIEDVDRCLVQGMVIKISVRISQWCSVLTAEVPGHLGYLPLVGTCFQVMIPFSRSNQKPSGLIKSSIDCVHDFENVETLL